MSRALRCNRAHLKSLNVGGTVDKGQGKGTQHVNLVQIIAQVNSDPSQSGLWGNGLFQHIRWAGCTSLHLPTQAATTAGIKGIPRRTESNLCHWSGVVC